MSNLSLLEATLPPGFRFHPTDEELICDYLFNKQMHLLINSLSPDESSSSSSSHQNLLLEIDLNKCEPWDLPETACVGGKEWYFYSQRDRKYSTGLRTNRATVSGYWKATGKDRWIFRKNGGEVVGMRKTLVFYLGRAPKGKKTDWVMHEFRLHPPPHHHVDDWVLCRVFCKTRELVVDDNDDIGKLQIVSKKKKKVRHEEDTLLLSCCSSLPQLMELPPPAAANNDYQLSFDNQQQQVPCFSTILSNLQFDINPHYLPNLHSSSNSSSSSCNCDQNKDEAAVLSRFHNSHCNNFKDSTTALLTSSFGDQGISDQSFNLSDAALPVTMWYP